MLFRSVSQSRYGGVEVFLGGFCFYIVGGLSMTDFLFDKMCALVVLYLCGVEFKVKVDEFDEKTKVYYLVGVNREMVKCMLGVWVCARCFWLECTGELLI